MAAGGGAGKDATESTRFAWVKIRPGDSRAGLKPSAYSGDLVMEIRRFGVQDSEALWRLRMIALQTDPWSFAESVEELRQISVEEYGRRIGSGGDSSFVIGAFEGDVPVGMCGFYRETLLKRRHKGHLWGVFVAPAARGKRLGLMLAARAIETARTLPDLTSIQLTVSVTQDAARGLYRKLGFRIFGIEPRALGIGGKFVDEEHMVLNLDAA
jgi:ribosomal protein S18 acetylase RimI-like enzyme